MSLPLVSGAERPVTPEDVAQFYQLVVDREPESQAVVELFVTGDRAGLAKALFASDEFIQRVVVSAEHGLDIWGARTGPEPKLIDWACEALPLSADGLAELRTWGDSWPGVYFAILSDPAFRSLAGISEVALNHLKGLASVVGGIDRLDASRIVGWAMTRGPLKGPVTVEVYGDGAFITAGSADMFRRSVQDQLGGDGLVGFEIALPRPVEAAREVRIDVRAAPFHRLLGEGWIQVQPAPVSGLSALRRDISILRDTLQRLELSLPALLSEMGRPLVEYDAYHDDWLRRGPVVRPQGPGFAIFVDGVGRPAAALYAAVEAIQSQLTPSDRLVLIIDEALENAAADIAIRLRSNGAAEPVIHTSLATDPGLRVQEALSQLSATAYVLLTDSEALLAGSALAAFAEAFENRATVQALYPDEDALDPRDPRELRHRRHVDPLLRPGFDADLLMQLPYVGTLVAFRAKALKSTRLRRGCGGLHASDALLRLGALQGAVGHVPAVLSSRTAPAVSDVEGNLWAECVKRALKTRAPGATVEAHVDVLGAKVPGAARVRYPTSPVRVSVIVPTRDRLDLLKPCIDSVLANRPANRCELELIVIDHESCEAGTLTYLTPLAEGGDITILPFRGAFNWALMNNLAAARATGDVLVFLNNDTVVLTSDWLDELASQALRPEVGVVGCRLLYADGTIQHAGFVSRDANKDFLIHDGVGIPGSDGGYLGRHALVHASPVVTGACMAVRTAVFRSLGGFDAANLPLEGNDADFCYRARAEGLSVIYDPYATLYHLESKSRGFSVSGADRAASLAAQALLRERWGERFGEDAGFNPHFDRTGRPFDRLRPPPSNYHWPDPKAAG